MTVMPHRSAVLAHDEILKRLTEGQIFRKNTWDPENIRAAAYDLRIADDLMIVPDPKHASGKRYERGKRRKEPVVLRPGEVAFFSTAERLCVPWDLSANIGIKFGYARRGILILTGLLVDPGFGLKRDGDTWVAKHDERLHFLVANVGPNETVILPGDKIASIQFLHLSGNALQKEVPSTEDMEREFFDPAAEAQLGLSFFKDMANLRNQFAEFRTRFEAVERGSKQVVMFGVYLLTASILVGAFAIVLSIASSPELSAKLARLSQLAPKTWKGVATLFAVGAGLVFVIELSRRFVEWVWDLAVRGWRRSF